jgi:hypothetical protein
MKLTAYCVLVPSLCGQGHLHFDVGYTACPESFFTGITLPLQEYCASFKSQPPADYGSE